MAAACLKFSSVAGWPRRKSSASAATKCSAATAVRPMPASVTVRPSSWSTAPVAATDQSPTRRATFSYALPVPRWTGIRISASSSPGPMTVSYGPRWNSRTGTSRSPSWLRMTAVARTAANTADRSSDGSAWHSDPPTVPHRRTIGSATTRSAGNAFHARP